MARNIPLEIRKNTSKMDQWEINRQTDKQYTRTCIHKYIAVVKEHKYPETHGIPEIKITLYRRKHER